MTKIKLRLFIKELPSGKVIPISNKHYTITKYNQSLKEFNDEFRAAISGFPHFSNNSEKSIVDVKNSKFGEQVKPFDFGRNKIVELGKQEAFKNYKARDANTDANGYTQVMELPIGQYAIWINDNGENSKIARVKLDQNTLLNGFEITKDVSNTISLDIQVKQYYCFKLIDSISLKPLPNIEFDIYTLENNKPKKINRPDIKIKKTNKDGLTPIIFTIKGEIIFVGFKKGGIENFVTVNSLKPFYIYSQKNYQYIKWPSVKASSDKPVNTKANLQQDSKIPLFINLLKGEVFFLEPKKFSFYDSESKKLDSLFSNTHNAKKELDEAVKKGDLQEVKRIEKKIQDTEKEVNTELNKNYKKESDLVEIFTATNYKPNNTSDKVFTSLQRRYLPQHQYEALKDDRLNTANFKTDNLIKGLNQYFKDKKTDELKKAGNEELKKIQLEIKAKVKTDDYVLDLPGIGGALYEELEHSKSFSTSKSSQWMRAVGGAGATGSANWNPAKGSVGVNGEVTAQAKLILVEGNYKAKLYIPTKNGTTIKFLNADIGAIRVGIIGEFFTFAGAKVAASAGLGLSLSMKNELELVANNSETPSITENFDRENRRPRQLIVQTMEEDEKVTTQKGLNANAKVEAEAFAGIEGGISVGVGLEWLSPESKEFENIASVTPKLAGSLGGGAGFNFDVYLRDGQFRIQVKASLCLGIGAKGAVELTVGGDTLVKFIKCIVYQLYRANASKLDYIEPAAFRMIYRLQFLAYANGVTFSYVFTSKMMKAINDVNETLNNSKEMEKFAKNIQKSSQNLLYAAPEARGMLLYRLTRHGKISHIYDSPNMSFDEIHYLPERKKAILAVFRSINSKPTWDNTLQHMTEDGTKSQEKIEWLESRIIIFLNHGKLLANQNEVLNAISEGRSCINPPQTGNSMLDDYIRMRCKLVEKLGLGHVLVMNDSMEYDLLASEIDRGQGDLLIANNIEKGSFAEENQIYNA